MRKYKHLTEQEYAAAKWLLTQHNKSQVAKLTSRSVATMSYIDRSTSYENYRAILGELNERQKAQKADKKSKTPIVTKSIETTPPITDKTPEILLAHIEAIHDILKAHTTMLTVVNDKLDLVAVPKRKLF